MIIIIMIIIIIVMIITRVRMYVCFGFLLARSRRARAIDLQCHLLSLHRAFLLRSVCLSCMSVSVFRSVAYVEQGRLTCNVNHYLSVELFCFAACVCHVCLFRFFARSLTSSKNDRPAMSIAISLSSFFASQRVPVTAPNRREFCRSLANSLAKSIENHRENQSKIDPRRRLGAPKIDSKSLPGPSRDSPWRPRASLRRRGSVLGVSWGVPGTPRERSRVPKGAPERQKGRSGALGSALRRPKSTPSCVCTRKNRVFLARRVREASSEQFSIDVR